MLPNNLSFKKTKRGDQGSRTKNVVGHALLSSLIILVPNNFFVNCIFINYIVIEVVPL